jgi:hypothetical protein
MAIHSSSFITIVLMLAFPSCDALADSGMERPILGYATQVSPPEVRAILGVPGAAVFSDPLTLPKRTSRLYVEPRQKYAIIEDAQGALAVLPLNGTQTGEPAAIPQALQFPNFLTYSPSGSSAVIVSDRLKRLQAITGLPESPRIVQEFDLGALPAIPVGAAISDDAISILVCSADAVYLLAADGSSSMVLSTTQAPSVAFFPGGAAAAIGDPGTGSLYIFHRLAGGMTVPLFASGLSGLGRIAATSDGQILDVTDTYGQRIWSITIASGALDQFALPIKASRLDPLSNTDGFLIASAPGMPSWIFFRQGGKAQTVFVPAVAPSNFSQHVK